MGQLNYNGGTKIKARDSELPIQNTMTAEDANAIPVAVNDNDDRITVLENAPGGSQNLQEVTDLGSTTTNPITSPDFINNSGWTSTRIDITDANPTVDWFAGDTVVMAQLTQNITFVFNNLPQGTATKTLTIDVTGQYSITLPAYCQKWFGVYDGTKLNTYTFECVNGNSGSEFIRYYISTKENETV